MPYLYIEADEDGVAEQHGRANEDKNSSFISKLIYIYEYKRDFPNVNGRRSWLINTTSVVFIPEKRVIGNSGQKCRLLSTTTMTRIHSEGSS